MQINKEIFIKAKILALKRKSSRQIARSLKMSLRTFYEAVGKSRELSEAIKDGWQESGYLNFK